jgi:ABC-2 type transport system permease protein
MPLFQIGYRRYEGELTRHTLRWLPITRTGVLIAWRSKLLRRLVFVSFLPFMYFGWVFFLIGKITDPAAGAEAAGQFDLLAESFLGRDLTQQLQEDPSVLRSAVWGIVFAVFGTHYQLLIAGLVAAIVGPPLVSRDMRSRAFLIYFARPISRLDYVLGKGGVVAILLAAVTLLPSLLLYTLSILFSPSIDTIVQTAPVALTVVIASIGAIVPATLVVLAISSLTRQPRFATAAWIVLCTFGPLAHTVLQQTRELSASGWTFLVSLPHSIHAFQVGLYDVESRVAALGMPADVSEVVGTLTSDTSPTRAGIWLTVVSVLSLLVLLRRVDSPTRI